MNYRSGIEPGNFRQIGKWISLPIAYDTYEDIQANIDVGLWT